MSNGQIFYTDSNGLEMQKRVLNERPDYNLTTDLKVAPNYYPVTSAIAIRDVETSVQMTVMNDRAQGGSAIEDGTIELMQHRRLTVHDNRGVEEPLDEIDRTTEIELETKYPRGKGHFPRQVYHGGIPVNAKYYLQIFDTDVTASL